ncbi:hypothetical protein KFL_001570240 [Klebsormidium nitens]|uniref:Uncharacterized protein n=1 Tax=Klebsormidium nitens TaxID=105231 RepID=A0A0U9HKM5_KLENI|nr:hypothetical protein KFL_001570240 [Klebsormidium nitens]|eukprot:GAQ83685.1 hypothetical protein KFL_001570240 [Klebsormidium nitens]
MASLQGSSHATIWTAVLILLFCGESGVASASPVILSRRMLQLTCTPKLVDCSVTSCANPLALTGAQFALLCAVPGIQGAGLYGTLNGFGFNTDGQNTNLYKQAFLTAEGLSFYAHCAELVAKIRASDLVSLPACVNPDGVVYILLGLKLALQGAVPQVALLEVLVEKTAQNVAP